MGPVQVPLALQLIYKNNPLMDWRVKGVIQKALSVIPGGMTANDTLQRAFGELRSIERTVDSKVLDDWIVLAEQLAALRVSIPESTFMEIGTGWMPVFPLCFALCGARACHTFDLNRHLNDGLSMRALHRLETHLDRIAGAGHVSREEVGRRFREMAGRSAIDEVFRSTGIQYHAPVDASRSGLAPGTVNVVFSNSVLEHVPEAVIARLFQESARLLRRGGVMVHSVNCGDHYAYFDRSITFINYLKYTDREWRRWNNDILYQNRLRPIDFLSLAEGSGLDLEFARYRSKPELLAALDTLPIAPEFKKYDVEQLGVTSIDFACRAK